MSAWEQVLASALVGTERRPPPPGVLAVVGLDDAAPTSSAEEALLAAAAALSAWRRAGFVPPTVDDVPPPAPDDGRGPPSTAAAQVLELLVTAGVWLPCGPRPLIVEWLERAADRGVAVPPLLLPALLDGMVNDPRLIDLLGTRGRWLAAQDERWTKAFGAWSDAEQRFRTGARAERRHALVEVRSHSPADGRELLEEAWPQEKAAERAAFLEALHQGLSMDDEPFLEAALDDRSSEVRRTAAWLLGRLPDSQRSHRMAARAAPLLSLSGKLRKRIEAAFPDEPDEAARRDGIADADAPSGMGRAAWWLVQLLAGTPLSLWEVQFGAAPDDVVRLASHDNTILTGWREAAVAQRDGRWAVALFRHTRAPVLLPVMSPDDAAALLTPLLDKLNDPDTVRSLNAVPPPWSPSFSAAVVRRAVRLNPVAVDNVAGALAAHLDPSVAPDVEQWALDRRDDDRTRRFVRGVHHALTLRDTILKELS